MTTVCATICDLASSVGFVDPITKLPPRDECSLSALLCFYHHTGNIDWKKVPMISPDRADTGKTAAAILAQSGYLGCEYPLFWQTELELEARGGMRPDLLFLSSDQSTVAIIENKVGAADTHKGDEYGGQFGRYIKYLLDSRIEQRYMILLTSEFYIRKTPPWYLTELQEAEEIQGSSEKVRSLVIAWEDVLHAFATSFSTYSPQPGVAAVRR